jgi:pimeloyl-ACP methyl ester carboxylesterase
MKRIGKVAATAAAVCIAAALPAQAQVLKEFGSFHVGGRQVTLDGYPVTESVFTQGAKPTRVDPNGDFEVEQMYVQYLVPEPTRAKYPLLMWHGGGLTGVTWDTKPDGQPGWMQYFFRQGHPVYVSDAVERGRASWARYPEIFKSEPFFRPKKEGWELFRIGETGSYDTDPAKRRALPGTQFPVASFDQFAKQAIPRWSTNDAATQAAYDAYVQKACPCVIVVHSQGGNFAFNSALRYPDKVKAIVAVETSGSPNPETTDFARLKGVPMLWVWGDNLERYPFWTRITAQQENFRQRLIAAGGTGDRLLLPELGWRGNSHMLMMDRNSDAIAERVDQWLAKQGLKR